MKAFGLDMTNIQQGQAAGSVSSVANKTLFDNEVGGAPDGEFAALMSILGDGKKTETPNLLDVLNAAKENPDALAKLPKEVLEFIGQEFKFDGKAIINQEGRPIQAEDIISKIKELKPELLGEKNPEMVVVDKKSIANKNAKDMEVRNLLKSHDLGFDKQTSKAQSLFSSGDDFVQVKESVQPMASEAEKAFMPKKKMNGLNQYSKESKILNSNIISTGNVEMPETAVGMAQFKGSAEMGMDQLAPQAKVVDLSNISSSNTSSLIDQISKIIEQNNIKSADSMEVLVKHEELGQFKIEVTKNAETDQLDLKIISKDKMGHNFFVENEGQLAKALNQSGIKLSSFKVVLSSENLFSSNAEGGKGFSEGFSQNSNGQQGQFSGRQGENADSQRRRQLWQAFKENAEYASA